ncbi:MAG: twin-arginine translocase subunit TatC [Mucispirillum sp.]|nr:twin-arginine translocase subunit TatC [Mucispirillum sp.]
MSNNVNINKKSKQVQQEYPLVEHLAEITKRLKYISVVLVILFIAGYSQGERLISIIQMPILKALPENATMTMIDVTEMFFVEVKVSFIAALMVSMPFILYQLWLFIAPGLYMHERKYIYGFVLFASILFLLGAAFAYFVVFPFGFKFFLSFAANPAYNVNATLSMASYVSFVVHLVLAFGIVFELPAIIFLLAKIGIINDDMLIKYRRYAIVIIFILAAVLTPPDVVSQLAMAFPLILLYQLSIFIARVFGREPENIKEVAIYE